MLCIASEDIGNDDPQALRVAMDAWNAYEKLGMLEVMLVLAQEAIYLALAP
ncbi:recombination factor protein RarA, partial [Francisella tularensis subsp. holarctica]|nr:recombination factor protein RarA [Francisella tularensis subsp. holarctica]